MKKIPKFLVFGLLTTLISILAIGCASTKIEYFEDVKMIYSSKRLQEKDFYGKNFFVMDTINPTFSGFDLEIFRAIKQKISDGSAKSEISIADEWRKEIAKKGEMIDFYTAGEEFYETYLIVDAIYDKKSRHYLEYNFALTVHEDVYVNYIKAKENLNSDIASCRQNINTCNENMDSCDSNINECNNIINICSNPTIQKSRVVSVPYTVTERYWVAGTTGRRTNSSYGSSEGTPGHYETRSYTAYKNQTEYYTVSNPNYNPTAVAKARSDIKYWQNEKNKWNLEKDSWSRKQDEIYELLWNLPKPFILESWSPSEESE